MLRYASMRATRYALYEDNSFKYGAETIFNPSPACSFGILKIFA